MNQYCSQCGMEGKPELATGTDQDGEPACAAHSQKGHVTITATAVKEYCVCGREKGHRGKHLGMTAVEKKALETTAPPEKNQPKKIPVRVRKGPPEDEYTEDGKLFVADSVTVVDLNCGARIALMIKGDILKLLSDKDDRRLVTSLLNVIRCRGKMIYPFDNEIKDKLTGKMIPVQMDEGFVDDMISMAEPADKARMLAVAWEKE